MSTVGSRCVAVVNAHYNALAALPTAVADTQALTQRLKDTHGFDTTILQDLGRGDLLDAIDLHLAAGSSTGSALIILWTGHGVIGADASLRLMGTSGHADKEVCSAGQLGEWATRTGAAQVLVVVDTCFAAGGLADAVKLAAAVEGGRSAAGTTWFGVIAASQAHEPARSGALARDLLRLLTSGPARPDFRWHRLRPRIRGDDLAQALLADWTEARQTPHQLSFGRAADLVHNPLYEPRLPDQPLAHLLQAARGGSGEDSFFTGREKALAAIVAWHAAGAPGLFVVTGPAGAGKSAIAGRIVSLSSAAERSRLLAGEHIDPTLDPGAGSVDAQVQANGATVDSAADQLARQLGIDPGLGAFDVLAHARRAKLAGTPLFIVIDGLEEAQTFAQTLVPELLVPLAAEARILVTTRDIAIGERSLIALLGPLAGRIDLGVDRLDTQRDVHRYVMHRLDGVDPRMDASAVADELAPDTDAPVGTTFLLARLVTSQLRERPVDTGLDGWRLLLSSSVESALDSDIDAAVLDTGAGDAGVARTMLQALALAQGNGFPADDVWPAVATALSPTGRRFGRDDAFAVLDALGRHVVASLDGGQPVYRIAHQRLVDHLLATSACTPKTPDGALRIATAVFDLYDELLQAGATPDSNGYLWRFAWRHLATAGTPGLALLQCLVERDGAAFLPDLAAGFELASINAWLAGDAVGALAFRRSAVEALRALDRPLALASALFQLAIACASTGDEEGANEAAREGSEIARRLADDPRARNVLATGLIARCVTQLMNGRFATVRMLADEVVALHAAGTTAESDDEWFVLASALALGGQASGALGDHDAAIDLCTRAVRLIDAHPQDEAATLILRGALSSLAWLEFVDACRLLPDPAGGFPVAPGPAGERVVHEHRRSGRLSAICDVGTARGLLFFAQVRLTNRLRGHVQADIDPLATLDESIALVRPHADQIPDAAMLLALGLGIQAGEAARTGRRLPLEPFDEGIAAVRRFAERMTGVGAALGELLDARTALEMSVDAVNATPEQIAAWTERQEEAVGYLRRIGGQNQRQSLAGALGRLATLHQLGGRSAVASRGEAIAIWRTLLPTVPGAAVQLAANLIDQVEPLLHGRAGEALDCSAEAVALLRTLDSAPPGVLALAEVNRCVTLLQVGRLDEARTSALAAIRVLEPAGSPLARSWLGTAYLNLANIDLQEQRFDDALTNARRAVTLLDDPAIPPFAATNRPRALVTLAEAQRAAGLTQEGKATLRAVLDALVAAAASGQDDGSMLVQAMLFADAATWEDVFGALAGLPELALRCTLMRRRPVDEIDITVAALIDALAGAPATGQRQIRLSARAQRSVAPAAFDAAWRRATGDLPPWVTVEPAIEQTLIAWYNAPNWPMSRDYLLAHPELLDVGADIVLDEFVLEDGATEALLVHRQLLTSARVDGIERAYERLLIEVELAAWTNDVERRSYLSSHPELMRPEVVAVLQSRIDEGDAAAALWAAILRLAVLDEAALGFDAMEHADATAARFGTLMRRGTDLDRLAALAMIVLLTAERTESQRAAAVVLAIVDALRVTGDAPLPAFVGPIVDEALDVAIDEAEGDAGAAIKLVTDAIALHPGAAGPLAALVTRLVLAATGHRR